MLFQIKVCGVRTEQDVHWVGESQADAVGLNFHPDSVRYVAPDQDEALSAAAKMRSLIRVGIFVDHSMLEIEEIADRVGLDLIQLHGNQSVDWAEELLPRLKKPILRAVKLPVLPLNEATIDAAVMPWIDAGCAVLIDADGGTMHGGSGKVLHWESIANWHHNRNVPFAMAGGMNPENVRQAIQQSGAVAVDAASGTEETRGTKSRRKIDAFAAEAFSALGARPRPV